MHGDLEQAVAMALAARRGKLRAISRELPGVSYSWLCKVASRTYTAAPSYKRLRLVQDYLDRNPAA